MLSHEPQKVNKSLFSRDKERTRYVKKLDTLLPFIVDILERDLVTH